VSRATPSLFLSYTTASMQHLLSLTTIDMPQNGAVIPSDDKLPVN
jgi:hypothetical protein